MAQGEFAEARSAFEECLTLRKATMPSGHWLLATTLTFLGECFVYLGATEHGLSMIAENCDVLVHKLGGGHEQTRLALQRLENVKRWMRRAEN